MRKDVISEEQLRLALLIEGGLNWRWNNPIDKVMENHAFCFHNMEEDELFKNRHGFYCNVMGLALIAKYNSVRFAWGAIRQQPLVWRYSRRVFFERELYISATMFREVDDLHDEKTPAVEVIKILRTRDMYKEGERQHRQMLREWRKRFG